MTITIDTSSEFGQRVQDRLETELEIWLTVVNAKLEPASTLVWFIWHDEAAYILSEPNVGKVKAIRNNPNVVLHFNSGLNGSNMIVLNGTAEVLESAAGEVLPAAYFEKYRDGMAHLELTREKMLKQYSQPIRVTFDRLRGH